MTQKAGVCLQRHHPGIVVRTQLFAVFYSSVDRILSEAEEKCTQLLLDGVHVLILFCKSLNIKEEGW